MSAVGILELKNRLTHYLQLTKKGEEVVVTERGVPIALIQPITKGLPGASREARLARLSALGIATLPESPPPKRLKSVKASGPPASTLILEERR
jgi:prevent-host-death family protein